jgi:hypothetical protein
MHDIQRLPHERLLTTELAAPTRALEHDPPRTLPRRRRVEPREIVLVRIRAIAGPDDLPATTTRRWLLGLVLDDRQVKNLRSVEGIGHTCACFSRRGEGVRRGVGASVLVPHPLRLPSGVSPSAWGRTTARDGCASLLALARKYIPSWGGVGPLGVAKRHDSAVRLFSPRASMAPEGSRKTWGGTSERAGCSDSPSLCRLMYDFRVFDSAPVPCAPRSGSGYPVPVKRVSRAVAGQTAWLSQTCSALSIESGTGSVCPVGHRQWLVMRRLRVERACGRSASVRLCRARPSRRGLR